MSDRRRHGKIGPGREAADDLVGYLGEEMRLTEAYRRFATDLLATVESREYDSNRFKPFIFDPSEAKNFLQA